MSYKKFSIIIFSTLALYVAFNFITFHLFTKELLVRRSGDIIMGDLARMGYMSGLTHERKNTLTLPKQHMRAKDFKYENIDMITLGDSFSQGFGGGENRYYQDFLATFLNLNILNLPQYRKAYNNYLETVAILLNSGFLEKYRIKYIIIESTQNKVAMYKTKM